MLAHQWRQHQRRLSLRLGELAVTRARADLFDAIVVDEAQDLSPMQLRAVGRRCSTGSTTVLGDIAQGTTPIVAMWDYNAMAARASGAGGTAVNCGQVLWVPSSAL